MRLQKAKPLFSASFDSDDASATTPAVVTPEGKPPVVAASDESWAQARQMLEQNPSLMTSRVLIKALEHKPPAAVVRFMIAVNPKAASIPKEGPTPLQIAVQYGASLEVVQVLLEACPFALCVTNPKHSEDPLSYAKRHRRPETELLDLLSRPLGYWIDEKQQHRRRPSNTSVTNHRHHPSDRIPSAPLTKAEVDQDEFYNVKVLCAQAIKGHKKLAKYLAGVERTVHEYMDEQKKRDPPHPSIDKQELLRELHDDQQKHFFRQLIALDMKEKAMKAYVREVEERCNKQVESKISAWKHGMENWKATTDSKLREWQILLEHEVMVNAHFRIDFSQWMEDHSVISESDSHSDDSFLFATDIGEVGDQTPLFPKDDGLERVKSRPWKPLFRHRDRIMLEADD